MSSVVIFLVGIHCINPVNMSTFFILVWEKLFIICLKNIITLYEQCSDHFCINTLYHFSSFLTYIGQIIAVHMSTVLIFVLEKLYYFV